MKPAIQRVNVDFNVEMLKELGTIAKELNISRQAVIKTYLRQSIDQHHWHARHLFQLLRGLANAKTPIIMFSCYPKAKRRDCA
jgi:metal-responsive CopG/Arc/MetJ family transcriptional regulator